MARSELAKLARCARSLRESSRGRFGEDAFKSPKCPPPSNLYMGSKTCVPVNTIKFSKHPFFDLFFDTFGIATWADHVSTSVFASVSSTVLLICLYILESFRSELFAHGRFRKKKQEQRQRSCFRECVFVCLLSSVLTLVFMFVLNLWMTRARSKENKGQLNPQLNLHNQLVMTIRDYKSNLGAWLVWLFCMHYQYFLSRVLINTY